MTDVARAPLMQRFTVPFEYPVFFTEDAFDLANPVLEVAISRREASRRHRVLVVLDSGVADAWPDLPDRIAAYVSAHSARMELAAAVEVVPGGEDAKNQPYIVEGLQASLRQNGIDRQAHVLIIGGGAVLDMAGYVAGTTHRGVRVVRMPTTVLSQCDGGVGVKTGINAYDTKNFLGTFSPPFAVINDSSFLETLPQRDRMAGLVEVIKVGLIRSSNLFEWAEQNVRALADSDRDTLAEAIHRGAEMHLAHIAHGGDPFEFGSARPLDFGHWAAHKLEILSEHSLRHGEAVAIGMALDSRYAHDAGLLSADELARIIGILEELGLTLWHPVLGRTDALMRGLAEFREHLGGELAIPMLERIGHTRDVRDIDWDRMCRAIEWLEAR